MQSCWRSSEKGNHAPPRYMQVFPRRSLPMQSISPITTRIVLRTAPSFHFWRTAYSHGWCDLLPFSHDPERKELSRVLDLLDGSVLFATMRGSTRAVNIRIISHRPLQREQVRLVATQLQACLRLDEDFSAFHHAARKHPQYRWMARAGAGRLLRAPTVFEDVVKMICTTNCTWALTRLMVTNLVQCFGKPFDQHHHAFPTPETIASSSEHFLRKEIKAGYRSPFLLELAEHGASGKLDLEAWRASSLSTPELFRCMTAVKGIGPYVAGNIMKLIGRYDSLGLDSWVRAQYARFHRNGRRVSDATIEKHYAPLGQWRGLFCWLEMTRHWHEEKFRLAESLPQRD